MPVLSLLCPGSTSRIGAQDEPQGNDWRDAPAPRANLRAIRGLYDYQEFHFVGPYGENGWMEDYTAGVRGQPIKNVTLVTSDAAGQTQHVVGNYRPRSTLLVLSRLLGEKFAGTPIGEHFVAS